jgi:hypothetical protein
MDEIGISDMFLIPEKELKSCLEMKTEIQLLPSTKKISCYCPPGFTDSSFEDSTYGITNGLEVTKLESITCSQKCPLLYKSIMQTENARMCACFNIVGCKFTQRSNTGPAVDTIFGPSSNLVIRVPDDLKQDTSIVYCMQFDCSLPINILNVNICALHNVPFSFCNVCPDTCSNINAKCELDGLTRKCVHKCAYGFYMDLDSVCAKCSICPENHRVEVKCGATDTVCKKCSTGKHMPANNLLQASSLTFDCIDCPVNSRTEMDGGPCILCPDDYVIINNTCTKCNIKWPNKLRSHATTCQQIQEYEAKNHSCKTLGYEPLANQGLNGIGQICVPCQQNMYRNDTTLQFCDMCPDHYYTDAPSVATGGALHCIKCPDTHIRIGHEKVCRQCEAGKQVTHNGQWTSCTSCTNSTISLGGTACIECDNLHYANPTKTKCEPCIGKIYIKNYPEILSQISILKIYPKNRS